MLQEKASFRDPAGRIVVHNGVVRRVIAKEGMIDYCDLMESGLYMHLMMEGLLIPHKQIDAYTIEPQQIPFISYPYEWPFDYLKESALNTLEINSIALKHNMILKDASAYNMQFFNGGMILIDTLSFTKYEDGMPWMAYRQFVQHFLAPLLLAKYRGPTSPQIDGIDPGLAFDLLPLKAKRLPVLLHLGLQSMSGKVNSNKPVKMPKRNLIALMDNLTNYISRLEYKPKAGWKDYQECSYIALAKLSKWNIVDGMLSDLPYGTLCDVGANVGEFTQLALSYGQSAMAIERDYSAANELSKNLPYCLCLVQDICEPSPAIGWVNEERKSFLDRWHPDTIMALALIHHICIGNNVPLKMVAELFAGHCNHLIIEFVPAGDPMSVKIAGSKVYPAYSQEIFESEFSKHFKILRKENIEDSCRTVYFMSQ